MINGILARINNTMDIIMIHCPMVISIGSDDSNGVNRRIITSVMVAFPSIAAAVVILAISLINFYLQSYMQCLRRYCNLNFYYCVCVLTVFCACMSFVSIRCVHTEERKWQHVLKQKWSQNKPSVNHSQRKRFDIRKMVPIRRTDIANAPKGRDSSCMRSRSLSELKQTQKRMRL